MQETPRSPYDPPQAAFGPPLEQAPGATAAKVCGILSILFGILCFPVGLTLAIVALVKQSKAKRFAAAEPERYAAVGATGMVTAIIGLVMIPIFGILGMISAVAIPALLSQRARARDKTAIMNLVGRTGDLVGQYDHAVEELTPPAELPGKLEAYLRSTSGLERNPWTGVNGAPTAAFDFHIRVVQGLDRKAMVQMAESQATSLGQVIFVIEVPQAPGQKGFLAGAVRTQTEIEGRPVVTKVAELD